jgi:hypothetical protein
MERRRLKQALAFILFNFVLYRLEPKFFPEYCGFRGAIL